MTNEERTVGWKRYDAEMKFYENIRDDVMDGAEKAGISPKQLLKLELGLEEILVNIISYAYDYPGYVWVTTSVETDCFRLEFADHGRPFDPLEKDRRPAKDLRLEDREPGGFGIFLVKKNFTSVSYKYEELFGKMANHLILLLAMK